MYAAAASVHLFGTSLAAVRVPMAIFGVATVFLSSFMLRSMFGRTAAYAGSFLLTFSAWLVFFNRTGFTVSAFPLTEVAAVLVVWLAVTRQSWSLAVLAGLVVGMGIYGYFAYPLFALALGFWAALDLAIRRPRPLLPSAGRLALMGIVALVAILPMRQYLLNGEEGPGYLHDREVFYLVETPKFKAADGIGSQLAVIRDNAWVTMERLLWQRRPDSSDGSGEWPALDPVTIALAVVGFGVSAYQTVRRRESRYLLAPLLILFVSLGPVLSIDGTNRRSLGLLVPAVMLASIGASTLVTALQTWLSRFGPQMALLTVAVIVAVASYYAGLNVKRYFVDFADAPAGRATFSAELTEAAQLMSKQPPDTYVYFASERWSVNYETVRFLAGDVEGEDRISNFAKEPGWRLDRQRPSLILLLNSFKKMAEEVGNLYPEAERRDGPLIDGNISYVAFFVPASIEQVASP
jgi:4-amino-4-deoxy-L-arabinose transferase-like glycosyltransferase